MGAGAFALGMCTAMLPPEMLPSFWADWVYPWAPQRFVGEGIRSIVYLGRGSFDVGALPLVVTGCIGVLAGAVGLALPQKGSRPQ